MVRPLYEIYIDSDLLCLSGSLCSCAVTDAAASPSQALCLCITSVFQRAASSWYCLLLHIFLSHFLLHSLKKPANADGEKTSAGKLVQQAGQLLPNASGGSERCSKESSGSSEGGATSPVIRYINLVAMYFWPIHISSM